MEPDGESGQTEGSIMRQKTWANMSRRMGTRSLSRALFFRSGFREHVVGEKRRRKG